MPGDPVVITRPEVEGFPDSRARPAAARLARRPAVALAILGVVVCGVGLMSVATTVSPPAIALDGVPGHITWVLPGSFEWDEGIRLGAPVLGIERSEAPESWVLVTGDGTSGQRSSTAAHDDVLRGNIPLDALAVFLALIGLILAWSGQRSAILAMTIAATLATMPLIPHGDVVLSTFAALFGLGLPVAATAGLAWLRTRPGAAALVVSGVAAGGLWLAARGPAPETYEAAETLRRGVVGLSLGGAVAFALDLATLRRWLVSIGSVRLVDVASGALAASLIIGVLLTGSVPPLVIAIVAVPGVVVYPRWRRGAASAIDRMVLAGVRERASLSAIEDERGRVARELHDAPLQELSGVIRRLEASGADEDADALRAVARQIRGVVTELMPPVLEDLGLGPAISYLVTAANEQDPGTRARDELDDLTEHHRDSRPPANVELAVFRIAQEALRNALVHSGAREVVVEGLVGADEIDVTVRDDGIGLAAEALLAAERQGHLGMGSMRHRAATIGATLSVDSREGTRVHVVWVRGR